MFEREHLSLRSRAALAQSSRRHMLRPSSFLAAALLLGRVALAAEPANPPMTKIVTRLESARVDPDSFAAKPKTLYLAGSTYARFEEEPDKSRGVQGLTVVSEPDVWIINLLDRTGRHQVDKGPDLTVHCNILPSGGPKEFQALEFGKEIDFFKARNATPAAGRVIDGMDCRATELKYGDFRLVLYYTAAEKGVPRRLELFRDGVPNVAIRYLHYERDLPFNPDFFKPPPDIKMTEAPAK